MGGRSRLFVAWHEARANPATGLLDDEPDAGAQADGSLSNAATDVQASLFTGPISTRRPVVRAGWRYGGIMRHATSCSATVAPAGTVPLRSGARFSHAASVIAAGALAVLFWLVGAPAAVAQTPSSPATKHDLLRPLQATSMDISDGKRLAQRFCDDCHGATGIATIDDVPNLAGQRGPYLYSEMLAYLSGARGNDTMNGAITYLSRAAMSNVAAYYSTLTPAAPAPASGATAEVDALQAGKTAAAACAGCHGSIGITKTPGIPSLVGQEPKYLVSAMAEYKSGERKNDTMKAMVTPLSDATVNNIALFYALQKPARAATAAPGDPAAGQAIAEPCAACHGPRGISGNPASPSLAGQDAQYLATALHEYKEGTRKNATMKALSAGLDETAIKNLAAFYAGLQPQAPNVRKPLTAAEWAERCDRCHGVDGNSTDPLIPALAGQRQEYLERALNAYRSGTRRSPLMGAMSDGLSENDIKNIAAYYARKTARAVVYVPTPSK
jgi:cytochrome c553